MDLRRRAKFRAKIWTRVERPADNRIWHHISLGSRVYYSETRGPYSVKRSVGQVLARICRQAAEDTDGDSG